MDGDSAKSSELWVFGYASLIWKPGFPVAERVRARLEGYRRHFCMRSIHHRGTPEAPGLVLALDPEPHASCDGVAFRVEPGAEEETLAYLRDRELVSSAYREALQPTRLEDGREQIAVVYVMDRDHVQYCGHLPLDEQAAIIARATGGMGPNRDYLFSTVAHLDQIGCPDAQLTDLAERVRRLSGEAA